MTDQQNTTTEHESLSAKAARNLSNTTKTIPQMVGVSPRWFLKLLPWVQVEAGTYRVNRLKIAMREDGRIHVDIVDGKAMIEPHHLREIALFYNADDSLLESITKGFKTESFNRGEKIITEGGAGDKFYIIAKGKAEVSTESKSGNKVSIEVLGEGDFFGEIALFDGKKRNATVTALTPAICVTLDRSRFDELLKKTPNVRTKLEEIIRQRIEAKEQLVNEFGEQKIQVQSDIGDDAILQSSFVDYEEDPHEYSLSTIQSLIRLSTRVTDLYNSPINQLQEQIRLTVEGIKEQQEWEIINNRDFGLLHSASPSMRIQTRSGPPTPDDMDELLSRVWKNPAYFVAHPRAIAAFGRECTRRGVPPPTTEMFGVPFMTWRGVPIVPCNKLPITDEGTGTTSIMLMRVGEQMQGVVGLHQPGIPCEYQPSLSVRFMSIDNKGMASYLLTLYHSIAVLVDDALGVLENVEVAGYHDYK